MLKLSYVVPLDVVANCKYILKLACLLFSYFSLCSKSELNQKDLLYNIMIDLLREKQLDFPKHTAAEEGKYFAQVCIFY